MGAGSPGQPQAGGTAAVLRSQIRGRVERVARARTVKSMAGRPRWVRVYLTVGPRPPQGQVCDRLPRLRGVRVNSGHPGVGVLAGGRRGRRAPQGTTPSYCSPYAPQHVCHAPRGQPPSRDITVKDSDLPPRHSCWSCFTGATCQHRHPHSRPTDPTSGTLAESPRAPSLPGMATEATFSKATATITETRPTQTRRRTRSEAPTCPSSRTSAAFGGKEQTSRPLHSVASLVRARARLAARRPALPGRGGGATSGAGPLRRGLPDWPPRCRQGRAGRPLARSRRGGAAAAGRGAGRARGRRGDAEGRAGPSRASVPAPGAAEQGLISAGSWRPVRARAPRPNSMAIVRRPLCSGGGHFLRGRAGTGGQETLRAEPRPRRRGRPSPGSEATATCPGAPWAWGRGPGRAQPSAQLGVAGGPRRQGGRTGRGLARPLLGRRGWGLGL